MNPRIGSGLRTFTFASQVDQASIFVRNWHPPSGIRARVVVQITHGIAEHSGRYDRFAHFLSAKGCVVYAIDLRGHGQTAGPDELGQAGLTAWDDMVADINQLSDIALTENPALPLVAFGHSMGSALTQHHIQHHGELLAGAILCGTMGALPGLDDVEYQRVIAGLQALATGAEARLACQLFGALLTGLNAPFVAGIPNPSGSEWQTSDPEEVRAFLDDPLCGRPFSNSMAYSVLNGMHSLWQPPQDARIPVWLPILLIAGTDDPVGDRTRTIQELITRYMRHGQLAIAYRFYTGGRHEILNEAERDQVHRDVEHWLTQILDR